MLAVVLSCVLFTGCGAAQKIDDYATNEGAQKTAQTAEKEEAKAKIIFKYRRQTEKKNLEKQKLQKMILSRTTKKKKSISTSKASKKIIHSMILVLTI